MSAASIQVEVDNWETHFALQISSIIDGEYLKPVAFFGCEFFAKITAEKISLRSPSVRFRIVNRVGAKTPHRRETDWEIHSIWENGVQLPVEVHA